MNILVLDVAASESGALTVLWEFCLSCEKDRENHYFFCVGLPELEGAENTDVLRFPWVKKSWLHRIWFDQFYLGKLVREHHIDRVLSLQNMIPGDPPCEKWVYLHQSIPFVETNFPLTKYPKLWVYRHIIGRMICASLRKADKVIVQTQWMKVACAKRAGIDPSKVEVQPLPLNSGAVYRCEDRSKARSCLFYPATPFVYKNHMLLLRALKILKERGDAKIPHLTLTLTGEENGLAAKLRRFAKENMLPVCFAGYLPRQEVLERYAHSTLIFPSYVETVGLPLMEARLSGAPILASDCAFSHEMLDGYDGVGFFDPFDAEDCAAAIQNLSGGP